MMSHLQYITPRVIITELMRILNLVRYSVFVVTFTVYSIRFPPKVRRTQIVPSFCGRTLKMMCEYVTVHPTGIFLCVKKRIMCVSFFNFPENLSVICPNSFDSSFFQGSLFFILLH